MRRAGEGRSGVRGAEGRAIATVEELLADARRRLAAAPADTSSREAALLLGHVLGHGEAALLARSRDPVPEEAERRFADLLERRLGGEPVAYLLGRREFYGRRYSVDRRVLVPRPDSEHLVEAALELGLPAAPRLLDVGTGSGCLAITLALEIPGARVVGVDLSPAALALARANARSLGAAAVRLVAADLVAPLRDLDAVDLVVSNPPYVDHRDAADLPPDVRDHEPSVALFADGGGTATIARLLAGLEGLRSGVPVLLEIGRGQLARVEEIAATSAFRVEGSRRDLAGIDRVVLLRRR